MRVAFASVLRLAAVAASALATAPASDLEWLRWVQVDVLPTMVNDSMRLRATLGGAVDTIEWYQGLQANRGDLMRSRGIATSACEQYEYEESLQFDAAEVWAHFAADGVAMNASRQPPASHVWFVMTTSTSTTLERSSSARSIAPGVTSNGIGAVVRVTRLL